MNKINDSEDNINHVIIKRQTRDYDDYEYEVFEDRRDDIDGTVKKLLESEELLKIKSHRVHNYNLTFPSMILKILDLILSVF